MNKFGNNTNRTMFTGTCAAAAILLLLTGCTNTEGSFRLPGITIDNTTEAMTQMAEKETVSTVVSAEELTEEEKEIFQLEMRYAKGEFAPKDYHTLAKWYRDRGMVRRQRDLLEESYRLFDDKEAFEMLQDIWVNLSEEEEEILEEAVLMRQNLELADTYGEGIGLITSSDWFDTMMPKLTEGKRNYYLETEGKERLTVSLGFDGKGKKTAQVYHETTDGKVVALQREDTMVKLLTTGLKEDKYDGAFEAVTLWTGTGDMMLEEGTFTDGVYTGEYTCRKRAGNGEEEAALLYQNRENMDYTVYTGEFDEQGKTTLEQPDGKSLSLKGEEGSFVVYARDDKGEKCLFYRLDESQDKESFAFTAKLLGWVEKPVAETYEVVEATVLGSNPLMEDTENRNEDELPKVRIYDGRLQVMNRGIWVDMGKVESLAKEDPFLVYATKEPSAEAEASEATQEQDEENGKTGVREGSLTKPAAQKPETTKPAVTKPATPKPAPTPAPKPEPEPEPEEEEEEEEEEPTPTPAPTPEPTPAPTPTPEPTPTPPENTGDVDIEWTDFIL